jgi:hypothetical protein
MRGTSKYDIIHVNLNDQNVFAMPKKEKCFINYAHHKPLAKQDPYNLIYHNLGAWPHSAFLSLYTHWGLPHI